MVDYVFSVRADESSDRVTHRRAWHKGNFKAIRDELNDMDWDPLSAKSADDGFDHLANALNLLIATHIPMASPSKDKPPLGL